MGLTLAISACSGNGRPQSSPTLSRPIAFTVVARTGPPVGGATVETRNAIYIFAAPSADDLRGLVYASGDTLPAYICASPDTRPECWANLPDKSLLIATFVAGGCGLQSNITDARLLTDRTLTITANTKATICPVPGSGTQPQAMFWVVAVPLRELPAAVLTITVHGSAESGAHFATPDLTTTADLRIPLDTLPTTQARLVEATHALNDVTRVARGRIGSGVVPINLAIRQWNDPAMHCGKPDSRLATEPIKGYVIQMGTSLSQSLGEFHWSGGQVVSCPPAHP